MLIFNNLSIFAPKSYSSNDKKTFKHINMEKLIGRKREIEELMRCYHSDRSEFVILYGRRRIGKTFLVNQTFNGRFTFRFTGSHKAPKSRQLERFSKDLQEQWKLPHLPYIDSWYHAFDLLQQLISRSKSRKKKVVFFDEMPWIDTYGSEFVSALEDFWNTWASLRDDIMFVSCGSATSWMVDKLVDNQGGLHGRITSRIYLRPFTLQETEQYLRHRQCVWNRYTIAQCYMYIGGVPYYLSLLNPQKDLNSNIDDIFFSHQAKLSGEIQELYNVLFSNSDKYLEIVKLLTNHREGMTRQEIAKATKSNGGTLTKRLENLERCDFITGSQIIGNTKKGTIYRMVDFFTLFYYKFVDGTKRRNIPYWVTLSNSRSVQSWQGLTFELLVMVHSEQVIQKLGISGIHTNVCSWRSSDNSKRRTDGTETLPETKKSKAQIDMIIERSDPYIYLCEMKFSTEKFTISKAYEEQLRTRMSIFREETHTSKALLTTFITTYGVNPGIHSGIVQQEIVLDDLF